MDIEYIVSLGKRLSGYLSGNVSWKELDEAVRMSESENPFFTEYMQRSSMEAICSCFLSENALRGWVAHSRQRIFDSESVCSTSQSVCTAPRIGIVMAGNLPLVGFHDLLCVLVSGAVPIVKLSSKDRHLLPVLFPDVCFCSVEELIAQKPDALITMGGNRAAAYFAEAFPCIPKLLRSSRFSAAVLSGEESETELESLCEDISLYYGQGCRSITHLFVKQTFNIQRFAKILSNYCNNIVTSFSHSFFVKNRAVYTIDNLPFNAAEPFILVETNEFFLPVGVVGYSVYSSESEIDAFVSANSEQIQKFYRNFGSAQRPSLDDYPDGVDTLEFIKNIKR